MLKVAEKEDLKPKKKASLRKRKHHSAENILEPSLQSQPMSKFMSSVTIANQLDLRNIGTARTISTKQSMNFNYRSLHRELSTDVQKVVTKRASADHLAQDNTPKQMKSPESSQMNRIFNIGVKSKNGSQPEDFPFEVNAADLEDMRSNRSSLPIKVASSKANSAFRPDSNMSHHKYHSSPQSVGGVVETHLQRMEADQIPAFRKGASETYGLKNCLT
mmetsp:Transcript_41131/g.53974  ORF Transcript_41131/g.53974 Transcript_41131/m.53974 type:complete len:218 (+) Transcript_41131:1513-2166(+)